MIIYTPDLEKIGEINDYESLNFKRVWEDVGTFELKFLTMHNMQLHYLKTTSF